MNEPLSVREAPARYQVVLESQRIRTGYKQTEVGVIPEDWDAHHLGGVLVNAPVYGINAPAIPYDSRFPTYLRITDISEDGRFIDESKASVNHLLSGSYILNEGDIVFARTGASVGKSYLYDRRDGELVFAGFLIRVRPDTNKLEPKYLKYFTHSRPYWNWVKVNSMRSGQPGINGREYASLLIPLPPTKAEQEAIAEALSDADALIDALEQLIAKKRHLKQGTMQELLTGKKRLPGFSGEWDVRTIEQLEKARLLQLSRGNVISKVDIKRVPGNFPIYSSSVKSDGVFGYYGEFMFDEELITWSVDGGGHFFHRPRHKFSVTNVCGYMRADTSKLSYQFLAAQLQLLHSRLKFDYQDKAHPSVIRKAYSVSIPTLEEQTAIATILSDMDTEIAALETRLAKTRELKQGMMHNLLTGKIRLV